MPRCLFNRVWHSWRQFFNLNLLEPLISVSKDNQTPLTEVARHVSPTKEPVRPKTSSLSFYLALLFLSFFSSVRALTVHRRDAALPPKQGRLNASPNNFLHYEHASKHCRQFSLEHTVARKQQEYNLSVSSGNSFISARPT